jgi:hypothetical protein
LVEKFETSAKDRTLIGSKVKHLDATNFFVTPKSPVLLFVASGDQNSHLQRSFIQLFYL